MLLESTFAADVVAGAVTGLAFLVPYNQLPEMIVSTMAFSIGGLIVFAIAFWIMGKLTPFSIAKELSEDHNIAIGIVIASIIIGLAMIISAAVHG